MSDSEASKVEANLISRRTLLKGSMLTAMGTVIGCYFSRLYRLSPSSGEESNMQGASDAQEPRRQIREETYIDNFDC
jgi:hypothetical protein